MSAFLGPIHYWMYDKILLQNEMVSQVFEYSKKYKKDLEKEATEKYGEVQNKPLETVIDEQNIHGWLQKQVSIVEYKLAYGVTNILKEAPDALEELKEAYYQIGTHHVPEKGKTIPEIYKYLNDKLLDGMPCDRANELVEESEESVTWKRRMCVHRIFWDEVGGDVKNYYQLRESLIQGMLDPIGVAYEKLNGITSRIKRR
jgi:hypothetical protein